MRDLFLLVFILDVPDCGLEVGANVAAVRLANNPAELYDSTYMRKTFCCGDVEGSLTILVLHVQRSPAVDKNANNFDVV